MYVRCGIEKQVLKVAQLYNKDYVSSRISHKSKADFYTGVQRLITRLCESSYIPHEMLEKHLPDVSVTLRTPKPHHSGAYAEVYLADAEVKMANGPRQKQSVAVKKLQNRQSDAIMRKRATRVCCSRHF